jgi:hypothetical protein
MEIRYKIRVKKPQETHQWMNPKPKSESRATCGIDEISLDLPHGLIGNIIFRCSKGTAGNATNVQKLWLVEPPSLSWGFRIAC